MNPAFIELALKKQRLQMQAQTQRRDMMEHVRRVEAVLGVIDRMRDGARWAREHVPLLSSAVLVLVVLKPRLVFRLVKRAWLGFMVYRRFGRRFGPVLGMLARMRS